MPRHRRGALGEQQSAVADDEREHRREPVAGRGGGPRVGVQMRRDRGGEIGHAPIVRAPSAGAEPLVACRAMTTPEAAAAAVDDDEILR